LGLDKRSFKFAVATADSAPVTAPIPLTGDICDNLLKAHKIGYSAIEIHTRENADIDYKKVIDTCEKTNMRIAAVVSGRLYNEKKVTLIDDDLEKVDVAMSGMKQYIDMAEILGTDVILGWLKGILPDVSKADYYKERLANNIGELGSYAKKKGVKILVEAINRYETNYLNTGREVLDFIEKYNLPNTYIHLDTFHMNIEEKDIAETIKACKSKLGYIHFADSNRRYCGAGHTSFKEILQAIQDSQYQGYVSLECLPLPTGEKAAELSLKFLYDLITE
jgi:sugar phosphate isomerase/epimerase